MSGAMVLHAALPDRVDPGWAAALIERLPYAHRLAIERRASDARVASLCGVALLCRGLERLRAVPPALGALRLAPGGKPYFEAGPWFSISHSRRRVAVAFCDTCEIGIDVEDRVSSSGPVDRLERWTSVEAALKAVGAGIRDVDAVRLAPDLASAAVGRVTVHLAALELSSDCVARLGTLRPVADVVLAEESALGESLGWRARQ